MDDTLHTAVVQSYHRMSNKRSGVPRWGKMMDAKKPSVWMEARSRRWGEEIGGKEVYLLYRVSTERYEREALNAPT